LAAKGIIFDFDGTLYGDWRLWISIIEDTLREFNLTVTPLQVLELARAAIKKGDARETLKISGIAVSLAREQGLDRDEEVRSHFFEKLDARMDETGPGDNLISLLKQFKQEGLLMGIVTFVRRPRLMRRLNIWKLEDYFQSTITPGEVPEFKPSPVPYLRVIKEFNLTPKQCVVVGDEPVGILGGKLAGAKTIGLPRGFYSGDDLREAGADLIISSLDELPSTLFDKRSRNLAGN
jgi:HAD superfamily hydrolase (TIGR01509 family)